MPIFVPQQGTPVPGAQQAAKIPPFVPFVGPLGAAIVNNDTARKAVGIVTAPQRAVAGAVAGWLTPFAVTAGVALAGALLVIIGLVLLITSNAQVRKMAEEAVGTTVGAAAKAV